MENGSERIQKPLKRGQIIFVGVGSVGAAAPGWYRVAYFDASETRRFPEFGWAWEIRRLCDGLPQTIFETDPALYVEADLGSEEMPLPKAGVKAARVRDI